jgi:methylenetetrahydrofolate--tRNA-(uracil-5-)-methyltransferase
VHEPLNAVVVGGGLAGCEAAWQLARAGFEVSLYEMRPETTTEAHQTGFLAELVCSNSFKSIETINAHGLLKEELTRLGSLLLDVAREQAVPAGKALAVDRIEFARRVTEKIEQEKRIRLLREELVELPCPERNLVILASGPLTSPRLHRALNDLVGEQSLYFYDAISPIVAADSIDREHCFRQGRYGGGDDYLNCPLDKDLYYRFVEELVASDTVVLRDFETAAFFQGCLPVEQIAAGGALSLAFGPMKPVGLVDPATGSRPFAVLQLRLENREATMYNLVGFQTRLRQADQRRVFGMIPALAGAQFLRYGSVHRNTFLNLPGVGRPVQEIAARPNLLVAGQITGVEGYVESIGTGLLAGVNAARKLRGLETAKPPRETMLGALIAYIHEAAPKNFQPMNANFGLLPPLTGPRIGKKERKQAYSERALEALDRFNESFVKPVFN